MEGWIKLHRQIMDNPLYFSEEFTRCQAWIDLLLLANTKDGYFYKRGIKVIVGRGQVGYDIESLAKRWTWSRGKVERFINGLENDSQIVRQKNNVTTLISICKYNEYQTGNNANSNPNDKANGHQIVKQIVKQTDTNKKEKNIKKDNIFLREEKKIDFSDFIPISEISNFLLSDTYKCNYKCSAYNLTRTELESYVSKFISKLKSENITGKTGKNVNAHFSKWMQNLFKKPRKKSIYER